MDIKEKTGLALSGGGVRAAAFHLGVLDKLNEMKILDKIDVISTVSGGSITGAYYMYHQGDFNKFKEEMVPNLKKSIELRIIFNWRIIFAFFNPYYSRTNILSSVYDKLYFKKKKMSDLKKYPSLVINATSLVTGKNWKFTQEYMGDWKLGFTRNAGKIRIADAVASSSAVPGFFRPLIIKVAKYFDKPKFKVKRVGLCDAGVYDNQGTNSLTSGYEENRCKNIICSDASAPIKDREVKISFRLFTVLLRQTNIMMARIKNLKYQNLLYLGEKDKFNTAYFSIDWTINNLIKYFIKQEDLGRKLGIWEYIKQFEGRSPNDVSDAEFSEAKKKIIAELHYPEMIDPLNDEEVAKIAKMRTRLYALDDDELNVLMRHGSELCGFQIRVYLPELMENKTKS